MAAFSYHHQYHPLLLHPAYLPSSPCTEMTNSSSSTCLILQHNNPSSIAIPNPSESEAMPSFESSSGSGSSLGSVRVALPVVSGTGTQMNSNGGQEQLPPTPQASMEKKKKKRKSRDCTSLCSAQPKDAKGKSRKQKEHAEEKKVEADDGKGEAKPSDQEPPKGYIHVRARRGQATDSHSLAERVRREKIRERMDLLQGLVPGCDKITGKALMLDEIINYVQSLQNQVEFLSMKLASMNPMLYDFGFHLDGHTDHQPQTMGSMTQGSLTVPSVLQTSTPIYHHTALEDATCRNYPMMETSTPLLLHGQGSIALPPQDNGSVLMQVADKRQELLNQAVFNNMCSFQ